MNTYVPVRKIIKIVSTHRVNKRDRHSSLQECLDSSKETRRKRWRWKPFVILFFASSALIYVYWHRAHYFPAANGRIDVNTITYYPLQEQKPAEQNRLDDEKTSEATDTESTTEDYKKDSFDPVSERRPKMPFCFRKKPFDKFTLNLTYVDKLEKIGYPLVKKGGYYRPPNCTARRRVGIIVPYRNRKENLAVFLYNIHPFLMQQKLEYQIFVIEQEGKELFNKGRLLNAGFKEMLKFNTFHCVILHDLDLLPLDENILYSCPTVPRHMCAHVNDTDINRKFNSTYSFRSLFGGVVSMTIEQYQRANGFSNLYFGWGGEDNDMYWRLRAAGYPIVRYNKSVGVYVVLPHERVPENPFRHHLLSRAVERYRIDGLSDLEYYVAYTYFRRLCTHIVVDINPRGDNITELNNKWGSSFYKFK